VASTRPELLSDPTSTRAKWPAVSFSSRSSGRLSSASMR
jgi:hypothetical protein